ncbi:MAG TPA: hypothetical protein VII78_08285 [Myxococcota bacterium]|jgi:hypothetical protein
MPRRFNHMELTLPKGALEASRGEIKTFYADLFGWDALDVPILKQIGLLLRTDPETSQFILVTEQRAHMTSPGFDHLGLLCDSRAEVDELLAKARAWRERDSRVELKEYDDLISGPVTTHAFYVRFLLPIWFDVQVLEYRDGAGPERRWSYGA